MRIYHSSLPPASQTPEDKGTHSADAIFAPCTTSMASGIPPSSQQGAEPPGCFHTVALRALLILLGAFQLSGIVFGFGCCDPQYICTEYYSATQQTCPDAEAIELRSVALLLLSWLSLTHLCAYGSGLPR